MRVTVLDVRNLRIIRNERIQPAGRVNWIVGGIGAGKTSLLEAVFLLARGRSFRGSRYGPLLRQGANELSVKGDILRNGMRGTVKLVGGRGRRRLFDNGNQVHRVRDLKDRIQVRVIAENAQGLLDGEPSVRRLFLDWNLFHVERGYADLHSAFRKILAQRNAWLRSGAHGPAIWDGAFIDLSEKISRIRNRYAEHLSVMLESLKRKHPRFPLLRVSIDRGWPSEKTLGDALSAAFGRDFQRGYTSVGPARADLQVTIDGICGIGSRGQVKLAVCLIQYAAQSVASDRGAADTCVWLLDDLDAELDAKTTASLWDAFLDTKEQIFVTGRDRDAANLTTHGLAQARVFHVEHGAIRD